MKIPSYKRLYKTDYDKESQPLVEQISGSVNNGFDVVYEALNGKLTFNDNFLGTIKSFTVTVGANGVPTQSTIINFDFNGRVAGVLPINSVNLVNSNIYPTSGINVGFTATTSSITINNVAGIQPNQPYQITIIILGI